MKKTPEQISFNMRRVKNHGSKIERSLMLELWYRGLRYRKNVNSIFGKPDIVFLGKKIAVFVDSEFWHGYDWENKREEIKSHQEFWYAKIERNMQRDREVNNYLQSTGWLVIRFWGNQIKHELNRCADIVERAYKER